MSSTPAAVSASGLYLAFCDREAASYAVRRWHYSGGPPAGRLVCVGVWEGGQFIGAIVFGRGASSEIHSPFGLRQDQVCELCRVALGPHTAPTSQVVSIAVRLLRRYCPNLRLIISYADPEHGHVGTLYQSLGWQFIGRTARESLIRLNGRLVHPRTVTSRYRTRSIDWLREHVAADAAHVRTLPKFRYALPLDAGMRQQLAPRVQPYPKATVLERDRSTDSGARGPQAGAFFPFRPQRRNHPRGGGARPTRSLSIVPEAACLMSR
jgi:hypothetical protein